MILDSVVTDYKNAIMDLIAIYVCSLNYIYENIIRKAIYKRIFFLTNVDVLTDIVKSQNVRELNLSRLIVLKSSLKSSGYLKPASKVSLFYCR